MHVRDKLTPGMVPMPGVTVSGTLVEAGLVHPVDYATQCPDHDDCDDCDDCHCPMLQSDNPTKESRGVTSDVHVRTCSTPLYELSLNGDASYHYRLLAELGFVGSRHI